LASLDGADVVTPKLWAELLDVERLPECGVGASGRAVFCFDQGDDLVARQFCNGFDFALAASIFDDCGRRDWFAGGFFVG